MTTSSRSLPSLLGRAALILAAAAPLRAETIIKFATIAPEGSTWMKVMSDLDKELQEKTAGAVRFRFYAGGVSGDEKDVIRKIRIGQLQAGGFTGVGLGAIAPEIRILDAPFLFRTYGELDHVRGAVEKELSGTLESKGYVILGWTEVGFIYMFTAKPIRTLEDLRQTKMWVWEGDPIAETAFKAAKVNPIPLSVTDVTSSLQTGLINGVYGSPLAVLALQWYSNTPFIHDYPMAHSIGAVLLSKKVYDGLEPGQQKILRELSEKHLQRLSDLGRTENQKAMETLKKQGLSLVSPAKETLEAYEKIGREAREKLVGVLYPRSLLDQVEQLLASYRGEHAQKN